MATIDSAYQYYLSTYGTSTVSRAMTRTRKASQGDTYNKIVKTNKESPLYKNQNLGEAKNMRLISGKCRRHPAYRAFTFTLTRALKKLFSKRLPSHRMKMS